MQDPSAPRSAGGRTSTYWELKWMSGSDHEEVAKLLGFENVGDMDFTVLWIFDQARTRGTDLRNPPKSRGLVTVNSDTGAAVLFQAMKRMRGFTDDHPMYPQYVDFVLSSKAEQEKIDEDVKNLPWGVSLSLLAELHSDPQPTDAVVDWGSYPELTEAANQQTDAPLWALAEREASSTMTDFWTDFRPKSIARDSRKEIAEHRDKMLRIVTNARLNDREGKRLATRDRTDHVRRVDLLRGAAGRAGLLAVPKNFSQKFTIFDQTCLCAIKRQFQSVYKRDSCGGTCDVS